LAFILTFYFRHSWERKGYAPESVERPCIVKFMSKETTAFGWFAGIHLV